MKTEPEYRIMKLVGFESGRAGDRFFMMDKVTGEEFRWMPRELFEWLQGQEIDGWWTTAKPGGYPVIHLDHEAE